MTPNPLEHSESIPVADADVGKTISALLRQCRPDLSWGAVRQRILGRHVEMNGNLCLDPARRVTLKDQIRLWQHARPKPIEPSDIQVVFVDTYLVIVDKPAGVTSARHFEERTMSNRRRQLQPTMEELLPITLTDWYHSQSRRRDKPLRGEAHRQQVQKNRVVPVHRLDRDTSGLMLFARSKIAAESLGKMFRTHTIDRRYWGVAHGKVESMTLESYLVRDVGGGRRGSVADPNTPGAQKAVTHVRQLQTIGPFTLLECKLETGRTHQIRIHLAEAGHPLCGEKLYGQDVTPTIEAPLQPPRHALHAFRLTFQHPFTQEKLDFRSGWPADLQPWFKRLSDSTA
jgi:23S rRNA pseudouridine1911/1915/1917 synthase